MTLCPIHFYFFLVCFHQTCKDRLLIFSVALFGFSGYLILAYLMNNKGFGLVNPLDLVEMDLNFCYDTSSKYPGYRADEIK